MCNPSPLSTMSISEANTDHSNPPLVLVLGFLTNARVDEWGPLEQLEKDTLQNLQEDSNIHLSPRRLISVSCGSCSSLHDRACEIFYQLKGGTGRLLFFFFFPRFALRILHPLTQIMFSVDYGESHSQMSGHGRYGRTYPEGLYEEWDEAHPLHFLGHSLVMRAIEMCVRRDQVDFYVLIKRLRFV